MTNGTEHLFMYLLPIFIGLLVIHKVLRVLYLFWIEAFYILHFTVMWFIIFSLRLVLSVFCLRNLCLHQGDTFLHLILKVLFFYFNHFNLQYIWNLFLCVMWGRIQKIFFSVQISTWPSGIYWKDHPLPIAWQVNFVLNQAIVYSRGLF